MRLSIKPLLFALLPVVIGLSNACKNDPLEALPADGNGGVSNTPCDPDSVYFQNNILPLLVSNCAKSGCHDNATGADGIRTTSFSALMNSGIIDAGNPGNSDLMEVITETDPDKIMPPPPASPLTSSQISMLNQWISQGAQNNACTGGCDTSTVTFSQSIVPLLQSKCTGCHGTNNPGGGVVLVNYAGVQAVALNGKLLSSVEHTSAFPMPKNGSKLSDCEINLFRIWINAGSPNN